MLVVTQQQFYEFESAPTNQIKSETKSITRHNWRSAFCCPNCNFITISLACMLINHDIQANSLHCSGNTYHSIQRRPLHEAQILPILRRSSSCTRKLELSHLKDSLCLLGSKAKLTIMITNQFPAIN